MPDRSVDTVAAGPVGSHDFRGLMGSFPSGVSVVTVSDLDGTALGMTCSAVCSVSLSPPTLLVCLREGSVTLGAVLRRGTFALNLLHDRSAWVARQFAAHTPDRFDRIEWGVGSGGPHLSGHAHAVADCRVARTMGAGDHLVVLGEVVGIEFPPAQRRGPLVYGLQDYWSLGTGAGRTSG